MTLRARPWPTGPLGGELLCGELSTTVDLVRACTNSMVVDNSTRAYGILRVKLLSTTIDLVHDCTNPTVTANSGLGRFCEQAENTPWAPFPVGGALGDHLLPCRSRSPHEWAKLKIFVGGALGTPGGRAQNGKSLWKILWGFGVVDYRPSYSRLLIGSRQLCARSLPARNKSARAAARG